MCTTWTPWRGKSRWSTPGTRTSPPHLQGPTSTAAWWGQKRRQGLPPGAGECPDRLLPPAGRDGAVLRPRPLFDTATLTGEHTFTGTDYPCQITFTPGTPAASLTLSYLDGTQTVTAEETLDPADLTDGQTLAVPAGTASVLLTPYDAGGNPLQSQTVTQEAPLRRGLLRQRRPGAGQQGPPASPGTRVRVPAPPATTAQQTWKGPQAAQRQGRFRERRGPFRTAAGWALRGLPGGAGASAVGRWSLLDRRRLEPARWVPPGRARSSEVLRTLQVVGGLFRASGRSAPGARLPGRGPHFSREMGEKEGAEGQAPGPPVLWPARSHSWFFGVVAHCSVEGLFTVPCTYPDLERFFG